MKKTVKWLGALALLSLFPCLHAGEVVATVGGEKIDSIELEAKVSAQERSLNRKLSAEERQGLLQSLINQRLLVARAKDLGLQKKDEVRRTLEDDERQLLAGLVYDSEIGAKAAVSEEELKKFFAANPQLFELRQVSQILIRPAGADKLQAAQEKAARLKAKLLASPKTFAQVAKAESDDPNSKAQGGDLGTLRRGMLQADLEKAVFAAKPGSIVGPLQTQFGLHILQVRSVHTQTYLEARDALAKELGRARAADLQRQYLDELSKKYKVTLHKDKP